MFTDQYGNVIIEMLVKLPWADSPIPTKITVSPDVSDRCLYPLPSRDLTDVFGELKWKAQKEAMIQNAHRREYIALISRSVAIELTRIIQSRDPVLGRRPA